jgi:hypothetical protein
MSEMASTATFEHGSHSCISIRHRTVLQPAKQTTVHHIAHATRDTHVPIDMDQRAPPLADKRDQISRGLNCSEQMVEQLRGLLEEGQVTIEAKALHFLTGAQLLDYVEDIKAQLLRSEVEP